jgi:hypothetical protein
MVQCDICFEYAKTTRACKCVYIVCEECVTKLPKHHCPFCSRRYVEKRINVNLVHILLDFADLDHSTRKTLRESIKTH